MTNQSQSHTKVASTGGFRLLIATLLLAGCAQSNPGGKGNELSAPALNVKGIEAKDPAEARRLFQQAVQVDPFYGPAHNNLGLSFLTSGELYPAAKQFDQAIKLMPNDPQPRLNLGLVYEKAWQLQNAKKELEQALVVSPEYEEATQALARVRVKLGLMDAETIAMLRKIQLQGTDETWRQWAGKQLARLGLVGESEGHG